jgi:hypothetical protein
MVLRLSGFAHLSYVGRHCVALTRVRLSVVFPNFPKAPVRELVWLSLAGVLVGRNSEFAGGFHTVDPGLPDRLASPFVLIIRGDISDTFVKPNGIVLLANSGEFSSQGLRVTDLGQMWILGLDVSEERFHPRLVLRRARSPEVLSDRRQCHELGGVPRSHLGPSPSFSLGEEWAGPPVRHRQQDRRVRSVPPLLVRLVPFLQRFIDSFKFQRTVESDLDLGGRFLTGDHFANPLPGHQIDDGKDRHLAPGEMGRVVDPYLIRSIVHPRRDSAFLARCGPWNDLEVLICEEKHLSYRGR